MLLKLFYPSFLELAIASAQAKRRLVAIGDLFCHFPADLRSPRERISNIYGQRSSSREPLKIFIHGARANLETKDISG